MTEVPLPWYHTDSVVAHRTRAANADESSTPRILRTNQTKEENEMTKTTKKTAPQAPAYAVGDRVIATTAATLQTPATGTVTAISQSGWFIVELDATNTEAVMASTKGKMSARVSSLQPLTDAPKAAPSAMAQFAAGVEDPKAAKAAADAATKAAKESAKESAKAAKAAKAAAKVAKLPIECPECGSSDIELGDLGGGVCLECDHEWGDDGIEEALDEAEEAASRMSEALKKARARYTKTHRPDGTPSADNGDAIAKELRELDPLEVAVLADRVMGEAAGFHAARYAGLNNGQVRMNSGNRIRGAYRKALEAGDEAEQARITKLVGIVVEEDDEQDAE